MFWRTRPGRGYQEFTAPGDYRRSGYPDMDAHTSRFEPSSCLLGPCGTSTVSSSATTTFKRALKDSGTRALRPAEESGTLQQTAQGVSRPCEPLAILSFLSQTR